MCRGSLYIQSVIGVPRTIVGMIIGKRGQMIKMTETGAKIRFKPDDRLYPVRECVLIGYEQGVKQAILKISEIIQRANLSGGRGGYLLDAAWEQSADETYDGEYQKQTTSVPAHKCGLVIGKGGRWINSIIQVSGAHVQLSREPGPNPNEAIFNIFGTQSQIKIAIDLIYGKAGMPTGSANQGLRNQFGERVHGCWRFSEMDYTTSDSLVFNVDLFKQCLRDFDSILFF